MASAMRFAAIAALLAVLCCSATAIRFTEQFKNVEGFLDQRLEEVKDVADSAASFVHDIDLSDLLGDNSSDDSEERRKRAAHSVMELLEEFGGKSEIGEPFRANYACGFATAYLCGESEEKWGVNGSEDVDEKTKKCLEDHKDILEKVCHHTFEQKKALECGVETANLCGLPMVSGKTKEEFKKCVEDKKSELEKHCLNPKNVTDISVGEDFKCGLAVKGACQNVPFFAKRNCVRTVASLYCTVPYALMKSFECGVASSYFCARSAECDKNTLFMCLANHKHQLALACPAMMGGAGRYRNGPSEDNNVSILEQNVEVECDAFTHLVM